MNDEFAVCERCKGTGSVSLSGFIHHARDHVGCKPVHGEVVNCPECRGTGRRSALELKIQRIGKYMREWRRENDMTMREQAKILRCDFSILNDISNGHIRESK